MLADDSGNLEQAGGTYAAANAHTDDHVLHSAALAFDQCVADHARTSHAVGVTNGDAATIDVVDVGINAQVIAAVERLAGESFIEFPQANVTYLQVVLAEELGNGVYGADTHFFWRVAGDHHAPIYPQWLQAALFGQLALHQHTGGCPVGQLTGVTCRDAAALNHGLE